jgi:glycosyltransferase involved in cell wall biosynthesis
LAKLSSGFREKDIVMDQEINKTDFNKWFSFGKRFTLKELFFELMERQSLPTRTYQFNEEPHSVIKSVFTKRPFISLIVPAFETKEDHLRQMIASVVRQTYDNWELCLVDGSKTERIKRLVKKYFPSEKRIRYLKLHENLGISGNTNKGLQMAKGDYLGLLDHDDLLVSSALLAVVNEINKSGADMIYTNEDKFLSEKKKYCDPHFKVNFNRELLLGNNYICHLLIFSKELLNKVSGFRTRYDGAQDFDFILRLSEHAKKIKHIPQILYHWRIHPGSTAGNSDSKVYAYEAGQRAIEDYIARQGWSGQVTMLKNRGFYQISFVVPQGLKVGIYVWGKENHNNKRDRFYQTLEKVKGELHSCGCKVIMDLKGADKPEYILIMSRALVSISPHAVSTLLGSCCRDKIAMTGGKTLHWGKIVQYGYSKRQGGFKARYKGLPVMYKGYLKRAVLAQEVDGISSQLAVVRASLFSQMPPVHEHDLEGWLIWCYGLKKKGYKLVVLPQAKAIVTNEKI